MVSPRVRAVARTVPEHYASQEQLIAAFRKEWATEHFNLERLEQLHRAVGVEGRHLALPLDQYLPNQSFSARNDAWTKAAVELGEKTIRQALTRAELTPADIDHIFFVTVTGLSVPSIDARLINRLHLREDVKRT